MKLFKNVHDFFTREVSLEEFADSSAMSRVRRTWLLVREFFRSISRHQVPTLAHALSFKTLIAMIPMLVISLAVVTMLGEKPIDESGLTYTEAFIREVKDKLGPSSDAIDPLFNQITEIAKQARIIGVVGFGALLYTTFILLSTVEYAFNLIWQAKGQRPLLSRLASYLTTIVIVPLLMVFSVYLTTHVASVGERVVRVLEENTGAQTPADAEADDAAQPVQKAKQQHWLINVMLVLASMTVTTLALTALYYFMPYTPVHWRAAFLGGVAAGVTIDLSKTAFRFYTAYQTSGSSGLMRVYGPLIGLPLALLWLYCIWLVVLIGAEIAFTVQNFSDLAVRAELERRGLTCRLYYGVRTVLMASEYHHRGENPRHLVDHIAQHLHLPPYVIREIISTLLEAQVLRPVAASEDAYLPAKDIHRLTVGEVIAAMEYHQLDVPDAGGQEDPLREYLSELFARSEKAVGGTLGAVTFADLVRIDKNLADEESVTAHIIPDAPPKLAEAKETGESHSTEDET